MKIFLDTNIFLDTLLGRENHPESTQILNACAGGVFEGCVADITLLNIDYIARKQVKRLDPFLKTVTDVFVIVGADNALFDQALSIGHDDLEDTIQYLCAQTHRCDVIISNDRDFYQGDIPVMTSGAFVDQYL